MSADGKPQNGLAAAVNVRRGGRLKRLVSLLLGLLLAEKSQLLRLRLQTLIFLTPHHSLQVSKNWIAFWVAGLYLVP